MLSRGTMMENPSDIFSRGRHMVIYLYDHPAGDKEVGGGGWCGDGTKSYTHRTIGTSSEQHRNNIGTNVENIGTTSEHHRTTSERTANKIGTTSEHNIGTKSERNGNKVGTHSEQTRNNIEPPFERNWNKFGTQSEQHRNEIGVLPEQH